MSLNRRINRLEESAGPPTSDPIQWGPRRSDTPQGEPGAFQYRSNGHWWTEIRPDGTRLYEYWGATLTAEELKAHGFEVEP
jgi:hypothetical protein